MWDAILDAFIAGKADLVTVAVPKVKSSPWIQVQLSKKIKERSLKDRLKASNLKGVVYLEKLGSPSLTERIWRRLRVGVKP